MRLLKRIFRPEIKEFHITLHYYKKGNKDRFERLQYVIEDIKIENAFYAALDFYDIDSRDVSILLTHKNKQTNTYCYELIELQTP